MCMFDQPSPPPPPPALPAQAPIQTMKSPEADKGDTTAAVRSAALGRRALRSPGSGLTLDTGTSTGSGLNIQ